MARGPSGSSKTRPGKAPAAEHPPAEAPVRVPIEELARRTGVTVRNLRAMHARSLLQAPELVGRKGFYTERHVARVLLVRKLQGRGFSLAAIAALLQSWQDGGGLTDILGLEDALLATGAGAPTGEVDVADAFPELLAEPAALERALQQELVVERAGRYIAPDAELLGIVRQQAAEGLPLEAMLADGEALQQDVARIATRFRDAFFEHIVSPYLDAGAPASALPDLAGKVERLRPLAVRLVGILLAREIARGAETGLGAARLAQPGEATPNKPPARRKKTDAGSRKASAAKQPPRRRR